MIGYHVTDLDNLDSILEHGIWLQDTMENNYPLANYSRGPKVFFTTHILAAQVWARENHAWCHPDEILGFADMVIIEFETDAEAFRDPYSDERKERPLFFSKYVLEAVPAEKIIDIHEVVDVDNSELLNI